MSTYRVTATRTPSKLWVGTVAVAGREYALSGRWLAQFEDIARCRICGVTGEDPADVVLIIEADVGAALLSDVAHTRELGAIAEAARVAWRAAERDVAVRLRALDLPQRDAAYLLGVRPARISDIEKEIAKEITRGG